MIVNINNLEEFKAIYQKAFANNDCFLIESSFNWVGTHTDLELDIPQFKFNELEYFNPCYVEGNNTAVLIMSIEKPIIELYSILDDITSILNEYKEVELNNQGIIEKREKVYSGPHTYHYSERFIIADFTYKETEGKIILLGYLNLGCQPSTPNELIGPTRTKRLAMNLSEEERLEVLNRINEVLVSYYD